MIGRDVFIYIRLLKKLHNDRCEAFLFSDSMPFKALHGIGQIPIYQDN